MQKVLELRCAQGTHLLELLVALIIISILSAVSIPRLGEILNSSPLKLESQRLEQILKRYSARSIQSEKKFSFISKPSSYQIIETDSGVLRLSRQLSDKITLDSKREIIVFSKSGVVSPASLTLRSKRSACTITISLRGRINRLCS